MASMGVALYNNTDGTCNLLLRAQFKALLAGGADPLREDMWGHSAVDVARRGGQADLLMDLLPPAQAGPRPPSV